MNFDNITEIIEELYSQLGFSISCFNSTDFAYYPTTEEISYTLFELPFSNDGYKQFLQKYYNFNIPCSMFTFSLLHELGHYVTLHTVSKKQKRRIKKAKKYMSKKICKTYNDSVMLQIVYCKLYDERIATEQAMSFINNNYSLIMKYDELIMKEIYSFYEKHIDK